MGKACCEKHDWILQWLFISHARLNKSDCAGNRATYVRLPAPIVIEKLLPLSEERENANSTRSSISFTALSEERLQAAVKLAKRDLRRRHLESLIKSPARPSQEASLLETSDVELLQVIDLATTPSKAKLRASSPKEKAARPGAKQTSQKRPMCAMPRAGQSPPTRDPGPKQLERGKQAPLSQEIHKLQNELEVYIQKVEELKMEELLEPEEQNKLEVRRQKQAARSARIIYDLQKQVKEIQEDMEKLRNQKLWDTKKSTAVNRLAAAHRGALRALQVVINQLSDLSHSKLPPHYKELGQLIRQLSLCSAKVEVDQGSAVPETALDILQKLEVMSTKCSQKVFARLYVFSLLWLYFSSDDLKCELLRAGLESLAQQRELRELQGQPQMNTTCRKGLHSDRRKADIIMKVLHNQMRDAGFQQPTVSSRLRVNELPQKEHSVPWIPTSPHSPPQRIKQEEIKPSTHIGHIAYCICSVFCAHCSPQAAETAEQLSEALLEDLLEDTARAAWAAETDRQLEGMAQRRLQAPTLESMLLRMEEIQVRAAPQKASFCVSTQNSFPSEDSLTEEVSQDERQPRNSTAFPGPAERGKGTVISVPGSMLRSIRRYREDYEAYLRIVAHEAVGSFNPWAVANSDHFCVFEALADVAAEFQDVVEEYAEAVFTSEFLQPTQSPPAPAAALVSQ
uniref:Si:dkey-243i1.1 n=1 Tax=Lates calcarifer TaxID=8187 RepID=A0A4W6BRB9_LATCA